MIAKAVSVAVCASSFVYTFYVVCNFTYFLSNHNENQKSMLRTTEEESVVVATIWTLFMDTCLLCAFMVQHSVMASDFVKNIYRRLDIEEIERSVYNTAAAGAIHFLMSNWRPVSWATIWSINTFHSTSLWLIFTSIHVMAWLIIYGGCVVMDISELMGLKQVYYKISGRQKPLIMKSEQLQRLYSHMRHPSFTGFLIIFWIHPFMSVDRCLLAGLLTAYMILMWTVDQKDYEYHKSVMQMKHRKLF
ncbi:nurim homolog [Neodiprion fabricii]|uniref:nurim homolog n=1 Tax=Neodiprion fabricii TaxID=2872261 RepID=UPI001ED8FE12|nr:nurim homolog [Neodiprion fabricii]XP_046435611.1 nurim homolog [Neodiprion fabricii]